MTLSRLAAAAAFALAPLAASAHEFTLGDLAIGHPFALATTAPVGAGYLTVTNHGTEPDALLAVEAPFPAVTLHRTEIDADGMASMPGVDRFEIAPGETLTLAPGSAHVMFEQMGGDPLEVGESVPATLVFERAGRIDVEFKVEPLTFAAEAAAPMDHGAMDHGAP